MILNHSEENLIETKQELWEECCLLLKELANCDACCIYSFDRSSLLLLNCQGDSFGLKTKVSATDCSVLALVLREECEVLSIHSSHPQWNENFHESRNGMKSAYLRRLSFPDQTTFGYLFLYKKHDKIWKEIELLLIEKICFLIQSGLEHCYHLRKNSDFTLFMLKKSLKELGHIRKALDASTIVAITDKTGKITYVNDKFCEVSGYSRVELIGQDHKIVNSGWHGKNFFSEMYQTIHSGKIWKNVIRNRSKSGRFYWVDTTIVPFLDGEGQCVQFVAIRHDVTENIESQEKLRSEKIHLENTLEELKNTKTELDKSSKFAALGTFAAGVAHDFNNTLSVLIMGIESTLSMCTQDEVVQNLIKMRQSALKGSALARKLLDLGQNKESVKSACRILDVVKEAVDLLRPQFDSLGVSLEMNIEQAIPPLILDGNRMSDCLRNLALNSLHAMQETTFRPARALFLKINSRIENENLILTVTDSGCGILPEHISRIFDPFFTTKAHTAQLGTGLGLSMAFSTMKIHSGEISVQSVHHTKDPFNCGTCFTLKLPAVYATEEESSPMSAFIGPVYSDAPIWFVDDEKHFLFFLRSVVRSFGYQKSRFFSSAQSLLENLEISLKNHDPLPVLIVSDLQMPQIDGLLLLQKLQEISLELRPKFLGMTGRYIEELINPAMQMGAVDVLEKPLRLSKLREALSRWTDRRKHLREE